MNYKCLTIQEIPRGTQQKFKINSKLWRILGNNSYSAIMCSIIHYYLSTDPRQLQQFISQIKPTTQNPRIFQNMLITALSQPNSLQYFFDNLRKIDSQNFLSRQYLEQYLQQKGIYCKNDETLLEQAAIEFKIQFQAYNQIGNPKLYGKEERNLIILYNSNPCWYLILEEPKLGLSSVKEQNQQKECRQCHKLNNVCFSPQCKHSICIDCLKKNFQSQQVTQFKCPFPSCKLWIVKKDFLELISLEQKQKSPQSESVQQIQSRIQKQEKIICEKCLKFFEKDDLYFHSECSKFFCKTCLDRYSNKNYLDNPGYVKCLSCHKQLDLKDLKLFLNIPDLQQSPNKEEIICSTCKKVTALQDLFENPTCKHKFCRNCLKLYQQQYKNNSLCFFASCSAHLHLPKMGKFLKEPISSMKQNNYFNKSENSINCEKCHKQQKIEEVYNNYCGHSYCQSCADEEIVKGKSYFVCYSSQCQEQIIVEDVQQYFYSQLENKNKKSCNLCYESYLPSSMFKNYKCDHYLCYNCVNKIAQKQLYNSICPVKLCKAYINAEELDQYFTEKQEEMLKEQLEKEEEDLKLKQVEEPKQQQQHPSSIQSQILDQTILNEDEIVRIAIENSLENQNQQNQLNQQSKIEMIFENKSSQVIKAQEGKQKLFDDPKQVEKAKENMEIEGNNESEITQVLKQNIEGNCTFCRFPFSDFNLPQQLGCKKHRIGVCCLRYGIQCSQCIYQEIKQKEQAQPKKKFTIFQEESYYPHSPQYVTRDAEDAKPNSRLSSRIYGQPVQQNSGLYQSQALYTSTYAMRNASVGYGSYAISKRF